MKRCEACRKELPAAAGELDDVICVECAELIELELELELARGTSEQRCISCGRRRPNWKSGDRCECGASTVEIVEVVPRAN